MLRHEHDSSLCALCYAQGNDKRYLAIGCMYDLAEAVEELVLLEGEDYPARNVYGVNICKSCRARLLAALRKWRNECVSLRLFEKDHDGNTQDPIGTIPVRRDGITVMMTPEEYADYCANEREV